MTMVYGHQEIFQDKLFFREPCTRAATKLIPLLQRPFVATFFSQGVVKLKFSFASKNTIHPFFKNLPFSLFLICFVSLMTFAKSFIVEILKKMQRTRPLPRKDVQNVITKSSVNYDSFVKLCRECFETLKCLKTK